MRGALGEGSLFVAAHAHGRQFDDTLRQRDQREDAPKAFSLVGAVKGRHYHSLASASHQLRKFNRVGELVDHRKITIAN